MSDIKIMALGGVRENGKNLYIAEVKDSIFVLDAGLKYPENEQLGVDVIVPNFDYLVENKERVAGIFLSHGHADAIGALPYLLEKVKVPVFGSHLTIELAKLVVKKYSATKKFNDFHVINAKSEIDFGDSVISFFKTTHSIPESLGIVVKTELTLFLRVWELLSRQMKEILSIQVISNLTKLPRLTIEQTLPV